MNSHSKSLALTLMLSSSLFFTACGSQNDAVDNDAGSSERSGEDALKLYTTIFPLEDLTAKIGGDYVQVENLVPVGADAHTYEPTAREMISVADGDGFIYNGAGLEGFATALIDTIKGENVAIIEAAQGIELRDGHAHEDGDEHEHEDGHAHEDEDEHEHGDGHAHEDGDEHDHHDQDPHVWLDPMLAISLAENIRNALIELLPEQEDYFVANFEDVKSELETLDQEFQEMVGAAQKDTFIVSHAGYGYWEARYGLHQLSISGLSPTNEPSQKQLEEIIAYANEHELNYIMFEQNITPKVAEVVKDEVGAEPLYLHNLEALVQEDIDNGEDYYSLMRKNIEALRTALQ